MIAVLVVAGLLALPKGPGMIAVALSLPCLSLIGGRWLVFRGHRRVAASGFGVLAILTNVSYAAACVAPDAYLLPALFVGWMIIAAPTIGGFGAAWATLATRQGALPSRSPPAAWLTVIALSIMPLGGLRSNHGVSLVIRSPPRSLMLRHFFISSQPQTTFYLWSIALVPGVLGRTRGLAA